MRVPLDANLTAADVKQAFVRSGVLFEPRLAAAKRACAAARTDLDAPAPASDLKAALMVFRQVLEVWCERDRAEPRCRAGNAARRGQPLQSAPRGRCHPGAAAPQTMRAIKHLANALAGAAGRTAADRPPLSPEQATSLAKSVAAALVAREAPPRTRRQQSRTAPPPPYRGAPLAAQQPAAPSIAPDTPPHETAERLIGATDGALARTTLLQAASLPDQPSAAARDPRRSAGPSRCRSRHRRAPASRNSR